MPNKPHHHKGLYAPCGGYGMTYIFFYKESAMTAPTVAPAMPCPFKTWDAALRELNERKRCAFADLKHMLATALQE